MLGWEFEKGEGRGAEKYWLIKNAGIKGTITSKREDNQLPTFYIMVESVDDFITKSEKQGAKVVIDKKEISSYLCYITRSATKYIWFMEKQKMVSKRIV